MGDVLSEITVSDTVFPGIFQGFLRRKIPLLHMNLPLNSYNKLYNIDSILSLKIFDSASNP